MGEFIITPVTFGLQLDIEFDHCQRLTLKNYPGTISTGLQRKRKHLLVKNVKIHVSMKSTLHAISTFNAFIIIICFSLSSSVKMNELLKRSFGASF